MISFLPVTIIISTHPDLIGHASLIKTAKRYSAGRSPYMTPIIRKQDLRLALRFLYPIVGGLNIFPVRLLAKANKILLNAKEF
jgi:hypothetical protein